MGTREIIVMFIVFLVYSFCVYMLGTFNGIDYMKKKQKKHTKADQSKTEC